MNLAISLATILLAQTATDIPHVEVDFTTMAARDWKGKRFVEIIPADSIRRIVRLRESGFNLSLPEAEQRAAYDAFIAHLLVSEEVAGDWVLGGNEGTKAELVVLTKMGDIVRIEILGIGGAESPCAILIHSGGRGARVPVKNFRYPVRKG